MLKIAVCDDNQLDLELNVALIENYFEERHIPVLVNPFLNSVELLFQKINYDIYCLDMILPELDGIQLARKLREKNAHCKFIGISSDTAPAIDGYELGFTTYILKPCGKEKLANALDKIRDEMQSDLTIVKLTDGEIKLNTDSINYVDIERRSICYHLDDGSEVMSQTLRGSFEKSIGHLISNTNFVFLKPSLLINKDKISKLNRESIIFYNGDVLYFPKAHYQELCDQWKL